MKRLLFFILIIVNIYLPSYPRNEENKNRTLIFNYSRVKGYFKDLFYSWISRDFYPKQEFDFSLRSASVYETFVSIVESINRLNLNGISKIDKNWIEYLRDLGIIDGAVIRSGSKMYIIGNINTNIENIQGFHILDGSLYYYTGGKNKKVQGKFLINSSYFINQIFSGFDDKNVAKNMMISSVIIEILKNPALKSRISPIILYFNPLNKRKKISKVGELIYSLNFNKKDLNYSGKKLKRYTKLLNRRIIVGMDGVAYLEKLYSYESSDLVFLSFYKNKISANYIYPIGFFISVFISLFLLILLIVNIPLKREGGALEMEYTEGKDLQKERDLGEKELEQTGNPIEEIDNEVSKIILEENLPERNKEKVDKKAVESKENTEQAATKSNLDEIEELKKDGIIIK